MTADELIHLVSTKDAKTVLKRLSDIPLADRRKHAPAVIKLFRAVDRYWNTGADMKQPSVKDGEAVSVAVLATATLSEIKKLPFVPLPHEVGFVDVVRALNPDWVQGLVDHMVEDNPFLIGKVAPLWEQGFCAKPTSDAYILGYYTHANWRSTSLDEMTFLSEDVWRFFEVEGGGEFSLAAHDKYTQPANTWCHRLVKYAEKGKLDRDRLLDASLDALDRDFAQFRAGWYSRFHMALEPTVEEMAARAGRYLALLGSSVPPTVSFAMKAVQMLDRAKAIAPADLLDALEPALQARAKGTVAAALKLAASAAKRDGALAPRAAHLVTLALVSEDADVQAKALDLIEKLGGADDDVVRAALRDYVDLAAASVRPRIAALAGAESMAQPLAAPFVTGPRQAEPIAPVADAGEALALFLAVLEECRDPFAVERAIDGIARFGPELRADVTALSPLRKRAAQIFKAPGDSEIRFALAATGRALAEGLTMDDLRRAECSDPDYHLIRPGWFARSFLDRSAEVIDRVLRGISAPLLSAPSDTSGMVTPTDLAARMADLQAAGGNPNGADLQLALLRLDRAGRDTLASSLPRQTEAEKAITYAMGADMTPGKDKALWSCAWASRQPCAADPAIAGLFTPPRPDCGTPAEMSLKVWRKDSDQYFWIVVEVPVTVDGKGATEPLPALFYPEQKNKYWNDSVCGYVYEDVAWASLLRPAWPEPFFRQALLSMDTTQKLSDHYCRAYLDPFFRPGAAIGPLAAATLGYYLASEDKSVTSLTVEAVAALVEEARLDAPTLAAAIKPFLMSHALPTARWSKGLATIADAGHGGFARDVIVELLDFAPEDTPRDMGAMLELLFELCLASGTGPNRPEAIACLKTIPGGGKVEKFSKKLVQLANQSVP